MRPNTADALTMNKATEVVLRSVAIALMIVGAMLLVAGKTSVLPFALITIGIAMTLLLRRELSRHQLSH